MNQKLNITIPKLCHEDWNSMTPDQAGRFCSSCTKSVVDFTNKSKEEIQQYFTENSGVKVCGRFKNEQVNRLAIPIPISVLEQRIQFHKAFLLILFIVMGSTLFSCKNHNDEFVTGEPAVVGDSVVKENVTLGVALPPKDSNDVEVDTSFVYDQSQLDIKPLFKFKNHSFTKYFLSNFKVPQKYKSSNLSIFVSFIIERDGTISNVRTKNPHKELDEDVVQIIKSSPKWDSGKINNINVRSSYFYPFHIAQSID